MASVTSRLLVSIYAPRVVVKLSDVSQQRDPSICVPEAEVLSVGEMEQGPVPQLITAALALQTLH